MFVLKVQSLTSVRIPSRHAMKAEMEREIFKQTRGVLMRAEMNRPEKRTNLKSQECKAVQRIGIVPEANEDLKSRRICSERSRELF